MKMSVRLQTKLVGRDLMPFMTLRTSYIQGSFGILRESKRIIEREGYNICPPYLCKFSDGPRTEKPYHYTMSRCCVPRNRSGQGFSPRIARQRVETSRPGKCRGQLVDTAEAIL
jgi:hypothetical protein